jgi:phytoene dehydrogenase-like protein
MKKIIIIGAGMAGLSAGCYAQMNGYQTRIFELHRLPGGLCTAWKRKKYVFDGCIHWLIGSRTGGFHDFLMELGALQGREIFDPEEFAVIEGKGGRKMHLYADADRLEKHLKELSPDDGDVIDDLCRPVRVIARSDPPIHKPMELMGLLDKLKALKLIPMLMAMGKLKGVTVGAYGARFRDPFLREAFVEGLGTTMLPADVPMLALVSTLAAYHQRNAGVPMGGSLEFAKAIARRYTELGGEVVYKSRVETILVEDDRAAGVRTEDGTEHRADVVISAADGRTTIFDMLGGKYVDDSIRSYYDSWPIYGPCLYVSLGVNRDLSSEPHCQVLRMDEPLTITGEMHDYIQCHQYSYDPSLAAEGKSAIIVMLRKTRYDYWKELREDKERYKAEKKAVADAVIAGLETRFPGITDQVEVIDVATPTTYERYTGNWQGSYMGWRDTIENAGASMKRTLPGLGSFYMVGQWVYQGGGIPGSTMSGRHAIQFICRDDGKKFVTSRPE